MHKAFLPILGFGMLVACSDTSLVGPPGYQPGEQPDALSARTIQDDFIQRTAVSSDILFAVDDSCSMDEEQQALISNFSYFGQFIFNSGIDYHIGVVRATMGNDNTGRLVGTPPYLTPQTPQATSAFNQTVQSLGAYGGTCETGLGSSYLAITDSINGGYNAGFYRSEAMLTIVVMMDEIDWCTDTWECGSSISSSVSAVCQTSEWVNWVLGLKGFDRDMVHVAFISGFSQSDNTTPANCSSNWGGADANPQLGGVSAALDGITWSICNQDWSTVMAEVGLAAAGLTRTFPLTRVPAWDYDDQDEDGIVDEPLLVIEMDRQDGNGFVAVQPVWQNSPDPTNPWDYDRKSNTIVFTIETMPDENWKLKAKYPTGEDL